MAATKYHSTRKQRIRGVLFEKGQEVKIGERKDGQVPVSEAECASLCERGCLMTAEDAKKQAAAEKEQAKADAAQAKKDSSGGES